MKKVYLLRSFFFILTPPNKLILIIKLIIYLEKTVVFFKTFSLIHAHPENYIIELFINFKIHFILKHLLLYPNEEYIYDIWIHPKGQINRGCSYCIRTFQLGQIYSGKQMGGGGGGGGCQFVVQCILYLFTFVPHRCKDTFSLG